VHDRGSREVEAVIIKHPVLGLVVWIVIAWMILILIAMILTYFAETR
jgi:hypothetical protein